MRLNPSLGVVLAAGTITSIAAAQQPMPAQQMLPMNVVAVNGKAVQSRRPANHNDVPVVVYDNAPVAGGTAFYANGGLPGKCLDVISFTPGPGAGGPRQLTSLDGLGIICALASGYPNGNVDVKLEFFDTYNVANTPMNSGPIGSVTITVAVAGLTGAGFGNTYPGSVDISAAAIIVPDDDFAVVVNLFAPGTTTPLFPTLMPTFNGLPFPPAVGNSADFFGLDFNNNGVFDAGEQYFFGGTSPFYSNLMLKFQGDVPGTTFGRCCFSDGSCTVTTSAACTGTYGGDGTNCNPNVCPQPPSGACCTVTGCSIRTQAQCLAFVGAVYKGNNSTCATANCAATPAVLFSNCNLKTGAITLSGVIINAPEPGAEWSEVARDETDPLTANATAGVSALGALRLADDFVVPAGGMNVGYIRVYAYTTGATAAAATAATLRILNGPPTGTPTVVFGDTTTNRLAGNEFSPVYRAFNTMVPGGTAVCTGAGPLPGLTRHLQYVDIAVNQTLPAGTYWIDFGYTGVNFTPTSTQADAIGRQCTPNANALQFTTTWGPVLDAGSGCTVSSLAQDVYFEVLAPLPSTACYANCDLSTGTPSLTANDFVCFITKYAANDPTANCDLSTGSPLLTANDFVCFITAYAAGCS